ncbi:MAG: hypothetical protein KF819_27495 [Labilithrix sp.]|nr:hypothetical protein [Labilithrix sp.]
MRPSRVLGPCVFVLFASCAPAGEGPADAPAVGVETHGEEAVSTPVARRSVVFADATGIDIVDHATFEVARSWVAGGEVTSSPDGAVLAIHRDARGDEPGVVEVWRVGDRGSRARFLSTSVSAVFVDDAGNVTWREDAPRGAQTHTFDLASGVHLRFPAD